MRPLTNMRGGHEVFKLNTGKVIHRRSVTLLPVSNQVIRAVKALGKRDSMDPFKMRPSMVKYSMIHRLQEWSKATKPKATKIKPKIKKKRRALKMSSPQRSQSMNQVEMMKKATLKKSCNEKPNPAFVD
jgi:hypothetical protein